MTASFHDDGFAVLPTLVSETLLETACAGPNKRCISARRVDTSTTPNTTSIMIACAA